MRCCEVCGAPYPETHHIIFRSQGGLNIEWNYKDLCALHHKGDKGPHKCRTTDLRYKYELQQWLRSKLHKTHYSEEGLQKVIKINQGQIKKILKTIRPEKEGYPSEQIIFKIMGERIYSEVIA